MKNLNVVNKLFYTNPAKEWDEAIPFGNGRLGGMQFGGVEKEQLQLNEDSVWFGHPKNRNNPDALKNLAIMRELIMSGSIREAQKLAVLAFSGTPESMGHYQPLGDLILEMTHPGGLFPLYDKGQFETHVPVTFSDYERSLDMQKGLLSVRYTIDGVQYKRELFSSTVDQVVAMRLSASKPGCISFRATLGRERLFERVSPENGHTLSMTGQCGGQESIAFCAMTRAIPQQGAVTTIGDSLLVEDADEVVVLLSGATSFRDSVFEDKCRITLDHAAEKGWDRLLANHVADHTSLFDRVSLTLGEDAAHEALSQIPTDERLLRLRNGAEDPALIASYFQFGRYLLMASSRPGTLPANLQGIWNKEMNPPWGSKYTININTQMNYWPAEVCNLSECHQPLFDLLERMRAPGRATAREMYDCNGFVAHHNTDMWGDTAPQDVWIPATYWPMGAAWLSLHLWEHYQFQPDKAFLEHAYPIMREAATFFIDYLIPDAKGRLVTCPTSSPENTYRLPNGESGSLCAGSAMDAQILSELFDSCLQAADILGIQEPFCTQIASIRAKLPGIEMGQYGQIQEWPEDYEEAEPGHRHISQLFALYPGKQIHRETPIYMTAAKKTLERRLSFGGGHTGWSRAWIINLWARLGEAEKAYDNVLALLQHSTLHNLMDTHPPFQIDGNFGGTAGIAEMLLQSHANEIHLLPALPHAWATGSVKGLRARGGIEVELTWANHLLTNVMITADLTGLVTIRYGESVVEKYLDAGSKLQMNAALEEWCV